MTDMTNIFFFSLNSSVVNMTGDFSSLFGIIWYRIIWWNHLISFIVHNYIRDWFDVWSMFDLGMIIGFWDNYEMYCRTIYTFLSLLRIIWMYMYLIAYYCWICTLYFSVNNKFTIQIHFKFESGPPECRIYTVYAYINFFGLDLFNLNV